MSDLQGAGLTRKVKGPADGQGQALVASADIGFYCLSLLGRLGK